MYVTRPVELNPWHDGVGRGTLFNCVRRIRRALESKEDSPNGTRTVRLGSIDNGHIETKVDYVVTDPPYFDNLDYSYLARFHSVWLKQTPIGRNGIKRIGGQPLRVERLQTKIPAWRRFERRLVQILDRCREHLKRRGLLVFTFAHRREEAWRALAGAIRRAGFRVTAVYGVECEGKNGFHGGKGNLRWNALFICRRRQPEGFRVRTAALKDAIALRSLSAADRENLVRALQMAQGRP
jgi:adenine-specific DNA methylase